MQIELNSPLDMHLHLRDGKMLENVVNFSAKYFSGFLVMPNLIPPLTTKEQIVSYKNRIYEAASEKNFEAYMSVFMTEALDYKMLEELKDVILAVKLYPSGVTTNSKSGIAQIDINSMKETLEAMSKLGIVLSIHGETNGFCLDREREFMPIFESLAKNFPKLKIIMEHISTKEAVKTLDLFDNLYATVTVHHLLLTLDDVVGSTLNPHAFCKPILKTPQDRDALQEAVLSSHKKIMFGSDSAPHLKQNKESSHGGAGVFSAPIILPALAEFFDKHKKIEIFEDFISNNAKRIYQINPPSKKIVLKKEKCTTPTSFEGIVPLFADREFLYSVYV